MRRTVDTLGAIALASFALHAFLSWSLAASLSAARQDAFFDQIPWAVSIESDVAFFAAYYGPLLVQTACFAAAAWLLRRNTDEAITQRVFYWALSFALVSFFAINVLTQDFWLSVVWGRMANAGVDPYSVPFDAALAHDLPLDHEPITMTYGPLWALISAATFVTGGSPWLALALGKFVLLCAWAACLWLVREIARPRGARAQTLAMLIVGWLPLGVHSSVAEGHNDAVMMALALVWTLSLRAPGWVGPFALVASALCKYVTAPLAIVDAIYHLRNRTMSLAAYVRRGLPALALAVAGGAFLFFSGRTDQTTEMRDWRFLEPSDLLRALERITGIDIPGIDLMAQIVFTAIAGWMLWRLWRDTTEQNAIIAQLAIMSAILFSVVGHVWPWFLIWCVPFAALAPRHLLSVFVIAVAAIAPFTIAHWWRLGDTDTLDESVLMYGVAIMACLFVQMRQRFAKAGVRPAIVERH